MELLFFFVKRTGPSHTHGRGLLSRPNGLERYAQKNALANPSLSATQNEERVR